MPLTNIKGDILSGDYETIVHQCNCVTSAGCGLYSAIAKVYPQADIYPLRTEPSRPGEIVVTKPVIGIMAQYYPGWPNRTNDRRSRRLRWFKKCLDKIAALELDSVAFPHGIGCGLARGNWDDYERCISEFSDANPKVDVYVVKKV